MKKINQNVEHYYTLKETAELIKVSTRTLQRWIDNGLIEAAELPGGQFGKNQVRFSATAIRNALTQKQPKNLVALKGENERLRAALQQIVANSAAIADSADFYQLYYNMVRVAQMALDEER